MPFPSVFSERPSRRAISWPRAVASSATARAIRPVPTMASRITRAPPQRPGAGFRPLSGSERPGPWNASRRFLYQGLVEAPDRLRRILLPDHKGDVDLRRPLRDHLDIDAPDRGKDARRKALGAPEADADD